MQVLRYPSSVEASPGRCRFAPMSTQPRPRKKSGIPSRHSQASGVYARFSPSNKTRQSGRNSSTRNVACPVGVGSLEPATTLARIACSTESDTATEWPNDQSLASRGTQINWACPPWGWPGAAGTSTWHPLERHDPRPASSGRVLICRILCGARPRPIRAPPFCGSSLCAPPGTSTRVDQVILCGGRRVRRIRRGRIEPPMPATCGCV
jgi:hypothetical protein